MRPEIAVDDDYIRAAIDAVTGGGRTGEVGDGKNFVLDLAECARVPAGETGPDAIGGGILAGRAPRRRCHRPPIGRSTRPAGGGTTDLFGCLGVFYNRQRRHPQLGLVSPVAYEKAWWAVAKAA